MWIRTSLFAAAMSCLAHAGVRSGQAEADLLAASTTCEPNGTIDIAVVLKAVYEWGGYRYTNASDAIAAAKRATK